VAAGIGGEIGRPEHRPVTELALQAVRLADRQNVSIFTMLYACADIATAAALKSAIVRAFTAQQ
jgi:hypothetical protein